MKLDWLSTLRRRWLHAPQRRALRTRRRAPEYAAPAIESLEDRVLLSVTSISDADIAFSTVGENLFKNEALTSNHFDYTFIDESFGISLGGFSNGTGVKVSLGGGIEVGLNGSFTFGEGTLDLDYLTDVSVVAAGVGDADINNLGAGDHVTFGVSEAPDAGGIAMSSAITGVQTDFNIIAGLDAGIGVTAKLLGKKILNKGLTWDLLPGEINLLDINTDLQAGTIDFDILDADLFTLLNETPKFQAVERGIEYDLGFVEGGAYLPELDTGVEADGYNDSTWNGTSIVNKHSLANTGATVERIDFLHAGIDSVDLAVALAATAAGAALTPPTEFEELSLGPNLTIRDFTLMDGIFSAHFGVGQELTFTPELMVDLNFTDEFGAPKAVYVETSPGSGVYTVTSSTRIGAGKQVEIIHPGGELNVDTDYVLTGSFHNSSKLYVKPTFDLGILSGNLEVDLNSFDKLNVFNNNDLTFDFPFTAYSTSVPFHSPIPIKNLVDRTVTIDSFAVVDGSDLSLTATTPTDFSIVTALDKPTVVEGDAVTANVSIFDPEAAADDSDVYELTIDWKDGSTEVLTLDNSGSLPSHVSYDPLNHHVVAAHTYGDNYGQQFIRFTVVKKTPYSANLNETIGNSNSIVTLNADPDVTIDSLTIADDGSASLAAGYSDAGTLDSHFLAVRWGDGFAQLEFRLPTFGELTVGDTFVGTGGDPDSDEVLTITSVDAAAGEASFVIDGYTYPAHAEFFGGVLELRIGDDDGGTDGDLVAVPWGLDLRNVIVPSQVTEGGELTISATFSPDPRRIQVSPFNEPDHDVTVVWGDPNDPRESTFALGAPGFWWVGQQYTSTTDDAVLTITGFVREASPRSYEVSFEVSHTYEDDGDAALGNGTLVDTSAIRLHVESDLGRVGEFEGETNVANAAPTIILDPFDEPIGDGGVMLLSGHFFDPGALDTFVLEINWGDDTADAFDFGATQFVYQFNFAHVYAASGDYTITATVTDDDGTSVTATLDVTADFNAPPTAEDDLISTTKRDAVVFNVLADNGNGADHDPDGDLDASMTDLEGTFGGPGRLTQLGSGLFEFDPDGQFDHLSPGESAEVVFFYRIQDAAQQFAFATVTITITGVNDDPTVDAELSTVTVDEGATATNQGNFSDPNPADNVTLSASIGTITQDAGNSGRWSWSLDTSDGPDQSQTVTITATDGGGASTSTTFELTVNNVAPSVAAADSSVIVSEGDTGLNTGVFDEPGKDAVTLSTSVGTIVDNGNGTWSWSFDTSDGPDQSQTVTITASDSGGASTSTTFELTVNNVAPSIAAADSSVIVDEGDTANNTGTFSDPGADAVSLTASVGTIVDNGNGTWSWSFDTSDGPDQSQTVTITAVDSGTSTSTTFELTVNNVAPSVAAANSAVIVDEGDTATNAGTFGDPGADAVSLTASVGTIVDNGNGTWSWSFDTSDGPDQSQTVTITASDSDGASTSTTFELTVNNVAPSVAAADSSVIVDEGNTANNTGTFSDPGADAVSLTASVGTIVDNGNGTWSWSFDTSDGPDQSQTVTITASDSGTSTSTTFELTVNNVAPSVAAADSAVIVDEGDTATNAGTFSDPGADAVSLTASVGTIVDNGNGTWSWSFDTSDGPDQSQTVTITAIDSGTSTSTTFELTVNNVAPSVAAANSAVIVDEGDTATNAGTFGDPGADAVSLTASVGTIVDNGNGTWSWSFDTSDGPDQSQTVTITASDSDGASSSTTFQLTVANVAPTFAPESKAATFEVAENSSNGTVVGSVTAGDPGDDTLTYTISGGSGATAFAIHPTTGEVTVADLTQLDFETTTGFALQITVTDDSGATDVAEVAINLLNQASIMGAIFIDANENGVYEANEMGIDGVTVELLDENGTVIASTVTVNGGFYLFEDFDPGVYQIREVQPSGVDDGAEILGNLGGTVVANDLMELTLARTDALDYVFAEFGQQVGSGDAAGIGFWQNKHGQSLIQQGGTALAEWLTVNFGNVFGDALAGADGADVAAFYKDQLFKQKASKSAGPAKVDAQFMAVAFATFFTSQNLAGNVAASFGFNVTDTGIGTKVLNVGTSGAAFGVADYDDLTIFQLLQATDSMTDLPDAQSGFAHIYDRDGDGVIDSYEATLRSMANEIYTMINEQGGI